MEKILCKIFVAQDCRSGSPGTVFQQRIGKCVTWILVLMGQHHLDQQNTPATNRPTTQNLGFIYTVCHILFDLWTSHILTHTIQYFFSITLLCSVNMTSIASPSILGIRMPPLWFFLRFIPLTQIVMCYWFFEQMKPRQTCHKMIERKIWRKKKAHHPKHATMPNMMETVLWQGHVQLRGKLDHWWRNC